MGETHPDGGLIYVFFFPKKKNNVPVFLRKENTQVKSDQNLGFLVSNPNRRTSRFQRDFCAFVFQEITKNIQKMGQVYVFVTKIQRIIKQKGQKTLGDLLNPTKWVRC